MFKTPNPFIFDQTINLDTRVDPSYEEIFSVINCNPNTFINFTIISSNTKSYGIGATRQIYNYAMNDIIEDLFEVTHTYFANILRNDFWKEDQNISAFVSLIGLCVNSDSKLSYHLHPILLENITGKLMNKDELLYFLKHYNYEAYDSLMTETFYTGYDSIEEYIRKDFFELDLNFWKSSLFYLIGHEFRKKFSYIKYFDVIELDKIISGSYEIHNQDVLLIMQVDAKYEILWEKFIMGLNQNQIKNLLLLFGNSISLEHKFNISISDFLKTDIDITTCIRNVRLNVKLFNNDESLNEFAEMYLNDLDSTIVDIRENQNNIGNIRTQNPFFIEPFNADFDGDEINLHVPSRVPIQYVTARQSENSQLDFSSLYPSVIQNIQYSNIMYISPSSNLNSIERINGREIRSTIHERTQPITEIGRYQTICIAQETPYISESSLDSESHYWIPFDNFEQRGVPIGSKTFPKKNNIIHSIQHEKIKNLLFNRTIQLQKSKYTIKNTFTIFNKNKSKVDVDLLPNIIESDFYY